MTTEKHPRYYMLQLVRFKRELDRLLHFDAPDTAFVDWERRVKQAGLRYSRTGGLHIPRKIEKSRRYRSFEAWLNARRRYNVEDFALHGRTLNMQLLSGVEPLTPLLEIPSGDNAVYTIATATFESCGYHIDGKTWKWFNVICEGEIIDAIAVDCFD